MKLSRQFKMNLRKVAAITIGYVLINLFLFVFHYAIINSAYSLGPSPLFSVRAHLLTNIIIGLISGVLGGVLLVWVNNHLFRRRSFKYAMFTTLMAYLLIFILVTFVATFANILIEHRLQGISIDSTRPILIIADLTLVTYFILWGAIVLFTLFLLQVNDKFGPGTFLKFLAGNYHRPKKEERVFMFMDMRSSTAIAEKIGNEKYFNLLKDIFFDITDTIIDYEGEIYQYVGDEIVISWSIKMGTRKANCLRCFTQIQEKLIHLKPVYEKKYNVMPEFKAGLHYGSVMAGEVGVIKKDIIYSGDVLNTTSRIQSKCNGLGVDILISEDLLDMLEILDLASQKFRSSEVGEFELRGKSEKMKLHTITVDK